MRAEVARRAPGLRRVPAHRGEREARGARRPRRPTSGCRPGELAGPAGRAAARSGHARARRRRPWRSSAPAALDVLVATTVIEVGVDVPNATVMVDPRRRPLRHRPAPPAAGPGRAGAPTSRTASWSARRTTPDGEARLEAMVRTTDGFELAEVDLDLRGEGTIMGERQKGRNDLKLASLRRDREWVERRPASVAFELVDADPDLSAHPMLRTRSTSCTRTTTPSSCSRTDHLPFWRPISVPEHPNQAPVRQVRPTRTAPVVASIGPARRSVVRERRPRPRPRCCGRRRGGGRRSGGAGDASRAAGVDDHRIRPSASTPIVPTGTSRRPPGARRRTSPNPGCGGEMRPRRKTVWPTS